MALPILYEDITPQKIYLYYGKHAQLLISLNSTKTGIQETKTAKDGGVRGPKERIFGKIRRRFW